MLLMACQGLAWNCAHSAVLLLAVAACGGSGSDSSALNDAGLDSATTNTGGADAGGTAGAGAMGTGASAGSGGTSGTGGTADSGGVGTADDAGAASDAESADAANNVTDGATEGGSIAICDALCERDFCGPWGSDCATSCQSDLQDCSEAQLEELRSCQGLCDLLVPCLAAVTCVDS